MTDKEIEYLNAYRKYDNLDTALIELKNANYVIKEFVEDEDIKEDYSTSIQTTKLVLEQITYSAYIDLLIADIKLRHNEEDSTFREVATDIIKLKELKAFIEDTTNLLKELI